MKMIRSSFTTWVHKMSNRFTTKIYFTACIAIYNVFVLHWKSMNYIATSSWGSGWRRDRNSQTATATNRRKRRVSSSISRSTCRQQRKSWHQQDTRPFAWRSSHLKKKDHGTMIVTKYRFVFSVYFTKASYVCARQMYACLFVGKVCSEWNRRFVTLSYYIIISVCIPASQRHRK